MLSMKYLLLNSKNFLGPSQLFISFLSNFQNPQVFFFNQYEHFWRMLLFLSCHCYVPHISYTHICNPWHLRSFLSGGFLQVELLEQSPEISLRCLSILSRCCPGRKFHFISAVHNNEFPYYKLLNFAEKQSIVL